MKFKNKIFNAEAQRRREKFKGQRVWRCDALYSRFIRKFCNVVTSQQRYLLILLFLFLSLSAFSFVSPALAQDAPTPTPNADGNIVITVLANDSLWSIAARAGLTFQELLDLNGLTEDAVIRPGDQLIIGQGAPPTTPTAPPTVTPTRPPPTPSPTAPSPPSTGVCLLAFDDLNRDGQFSSNEPLRADVAFTLYNSQQVVGNYITDGRSEPFCLEPLAAGTYNVTRSHTPNEVLTNDGDWIIVVVEGQLAQLAFGSYIGEGQPAAVSAPPVQPSPAPLEGGAGFGEETAVSSPPNQPIDQSTPSFFRVDNPLLSGSLITLAALIFAVVTYQLWKQKKTGG